MARLLLIAVVARLIWGVAGAMSFLNPPSYSNLKGNFSKAITYKLGQVVNVIWTPADPGKAASLVLWQLDNRTGVFFGDMEYLTQGAVNVNKYQWLVGTRKDLSVSNLFYFSIFQEGKAGSADDNSEYLYLVKDEVAQQATSSAATTTSSVMTSASTALSAAVSTTSTSTLKVSASSSPTSSNLSDTLPSTTAAPSSFPLAAKIGMAVGIPLALALGLGIGYLVFRRRKKHDKAYVADTANNIQYVHPQGVKYQNDGSYYNSHMYEAPPKSPIEIARSQAETRTSPYQTPSQSVPVRYEM